ncbi:pseudouridylate synthase TRUB2, mitochondrial [Microplitis mediator]|uniref:pseudouridylate synthase TRUB2, mitochondrial n=1 Tax=Microplitis mediator TaxID=375433 RepID=UPI002554DD05|nr:pseudouridylate synthase TRUB2, mitochondrial [Microplitis mediator]
MSLVRKPPAFITKFTSNAEEVWKGLNGVFAIYKPTGFTTFKTRQMLQYHLCTDLNELDVREPEPFVRIEGETNKSLTVKVEPSYADHKLVVGPRYQPQDMKLHHANYLSPEASGIQLWGVNKGSIICHMMRAANSTRFYKIKGVLGLESENYFIGGKIHERSTFKHVKRHHVDMICSSLQSSHQRKMFEICGLDIQSQAAYELAVKGPIRPTDNKIPMLYSIRCIAFNPPDFTLEVVCINEDDMFLKGLVHNLGLLVRSNATCTQIQCYKYGIFTAGLGLLKRDWSIENIMINLTKIRRLLSKNKYLYIGDNQEAILREYFDEKEV